MKKIISLILAVLFCFSFAACGQTADTGAFSETQAETKAKAAEEDSSASLGEKNALAKAKEYLELMAFSKSGLKEQLEFEGFSSEEAAYGVKHCGANWNDQAARKADEYLDTMSFSKDGLIEQLKFDGFTDEQAESGVKAAGF